MVVDDLNNHLDVVYLQHYRQHVVIARLSTHGAGIDGDLVGC